MAENILVAVLTVIAAGSWIWVLWLETDEFMRNSDRRNKRKNKIKDK